MGYRRMTKEDVYEILDRWHAGQSFSRIASVERCDRKTIRKYIKKFNAAGLRIGQSLPGKEKIWEIIEASILPSVERVQPASKQLEALIKPIREMIQDSKEPIKPDLYDPKLNRALLEVAEYYGTFIDPCRVGKPTDKAKIEHFIPTAREMFRTLKKIHPTADIHTLNAHALSWYREEYWKRENGTSNNIISFYYLPGYF